MSAMWRPLTPYLLLAFALAIAGGVAYGLGAPARVVYLTIVVNVVAVLPGYERWDSRRTR
jgi:hypothetical protein